MTVLLVLPAVAVTICFFVILFGIEDRPGADPASTSPELVRSMWRWS